MNDRLKDIIEALIFISTEPVSPDRMKSSLEGFPAEEVDQALAELLQSYAAGGRGIHIIPAGGGYLFATRPEFDAWVRKFLQIERKTRLSQAALETLTIVAYHQPVTSVEISALRGVDSTYTLKTLLEKKLIKIVGRKKAPGNPLLYRTTEKFLTYFGLNSLEELPSEQEISKILEEKNLEQDV